MGGHEVSVVNVEVQHDVFEVPPVVQAHGTTRFQWTDAISGFMLRQFAQLVQQSVNVDKGFKEVHLNSVAKDVGEYSGQPCTGNHVYEHLRMWRARWLKVCKLKELRGASWDETGYKITLGESFYAAYVQAFPKDAKFLNKPIIHYMLMQIIFGNGIAIRCSTIESTESLGHLSKAPTAKKTELTQEDNNEQAPTHKKRQSVHNEEEFTDAEACSGIYEHVMNIIGFTREQLMFGVSYFIDNKGPALTFLKMSDEDKVLWLRQFLGKHNIR